MPLPFLAYAGRVLGSIPLQPQLPVPDRATLRILPPCRFVGPDKGLCIHSQACHPGVLPGLIDCGMGDGLFLSSHHYIRRRDISITTYIISIGFYCIL